MTVSDLEFHIAQVDSVIKQCRKFFLSKEKRNIYSNRVNLFKGIANSNLDNFDIEKIQQARLLLHHIAQEIEFLDFRSIKEVPKKLIKCLRLVRDEWLDEPNHFTIVFSNNSKSLMHYYTLPFDVGKLDDLNHVCSALHLEENYKHGLIHISQPRFFINDFLSSIPVYHEMGHFIDNIYGISEHASNNLPNTLSKHLQIRGKERLNYIREHFANIFAAQYLSNSIIKKIDYSCLREDEKTSGNLTHPSIIDRISIVNTSLTNSGPDEDFEIIDQLKESTKFKTGLKSGEKELLVRQVELKINPFTSEKAVKLEKKSEVHTLFFEGWNSFNDSVSYKNKYPEPLKRLNKINLLINKTLDKTL